MTKSKFDYLSLISYVKDRKGHDLRYAIDNSYIKKKLNWYPKTNLEELVKIMIDDEIKYYKKYQFFKKIYIL